MSLIRSLAGTGLYRLAARAPLVVPAEWSPVFLIGCGRSGTTITARVLGKLPGILALNEPRHMWRAVARGTDVWSATPTVGAPQVSFDRIDADSETIRRCRRVFYARYLTSRCTVLLEKLPLNSFRLEWIHAIFPHAKYVHLIRNGLDVAASIAATGPAWFGHNQRKWAALVAWARQYGHAWPILQAALTPLERGLVEWTLSVDASQRFFAGLDPTQLITIRYEQLVADPVETVSNVVRFLQLPTPRDVIVRRCAAIRGPRFLDRVAELPPRRLPRTDELLHALGYTAPVAAGMGTPVGNLT